MGKDSPKYIDNHVSHLGFGMTDSNEALKKLRYALSIPKKRLSSVDAAIYMSEMYDIQFGIFDHVTLGGSRPMSADAMFPKETIGDHALMDKIVEHYMLLEINKTLGLNINEWLSYPGFIRRSLTLTVERYHKVVQEAKSAALDAVEADL